MFGDEGLALNIARYNIGGGNASDVPSYLRPGAAVDGWWNPDLDTSDADGPVSSTYADRDRYAAAWDADNPEHYDFDADQTQRWWLDALASKITKWEAFSNSPPYFLTESGFVSGGIENGSSEQLPTENAADFASYLVRVVEELEQQHGIDFATLDPFNEPNTNYWATRLGGDGWPTSASRQEGAHIGPAVQNSVIAALRAELNESGTTTDVGISAMDETNPSLFVENWDGWSQDTRDSVDQLNVHTYGTADRVRVRDIAKTADKPLWMSEVEGDWDGTGFNLVNINNGLGLAQRIIDDMRELEPSAWVFWQPVEDLYNMEKVENLNWGGVFIDFDCDADGNSVRRIADGDADPSCRVLTNAKYNTARNFTHFIRPGDRFVPTNSTQTAAAISAGGDGLTLVHVNTENSARELTIDLSGFDSIAADATVTPIVTTQSPEDDVTANALVVGTTVAVDAASKSAVVEVPARSVATLVIEGVAGTGQDLPQFADGDVVHLTGAQSGRLLTADEDGLSIRAAATTPEADSAQSWTVHVLSGAGTSRQRIALQNGDGRLLGVSGDSPVLIDADPAAAAADPTLQWNASTTDGKTFALLSIAATRVLDVNGQSTAEGAGVGTWFSNNGGNQRWSLGEFEPPLPELCDVEGATVTASFHQTQYETLPGELACDGDVSTSWSTWAPDDWHDQVTYTVEVPSARVVSDVSFVNNEGGLTEVAVEYLDANGEWQPTSAGTVNAAPNGSTTTIGFADVTTAGVRVTFTTPGSYLKIPEISIPVVAVPAPSPTAVTITGAEDLQIGQTLPLTATVAPSEAAQEVTWSTSDASVASVSADGIVTAVSVGEVTISASSTADPSVSASVTITVEAAGPPVAAWTLTAVYLVGDQVSYGGATYVAQWWTSNQQPGATAYGPWAEVGAEHTCAAEVVRAWTDSWIYTGGETVVHDGQLWKAKWWTRNQTPGDPWGPWESLGVCAG